MSPSRKPAVIAGSPQTPSIRRPLLTPPVTGVGMNSTRRSAAPIHALVGEAARPGPASASASKNPTQTWTALKRIDGPQVVEGDQWKPGYKASKVEEMPAVLYCPAHTPAGGDWPSKVVAEREGFSTPSRKAREISYLLVQLPMLFHWSLSRELGRLSTSAVCLSTRIRVLQRPARLTT